MHKSMKKTEAYCLHRLSHLSVLLTTAGAAGLLKKTPTKDNKTQKQTKKLSKNQNQQWHFQYYIMQFCSET